MDIKKVIAKYPRIHLTPLPTPLEFAPQLTKMLGGPKIYVKRDDLTAIAFGGNKTRKLEFLMADAVKQNADTVITLGGVQSNWVRQCVAAARKLGMDSVAVLEGEMPQVYQGNVLLDRIFGAQLFMILISRRNWKIRRSKEYVQSRARLQKVIAREESILILCH